jgi:hypothetical protein
LIGRIEEKRSFEKPGHGWENNIKVVFREAGSEMDSSDLGSMRDLL